MPFTTKKPVEAPTTVELRDGEDGGVCLIAVNPEHYQAIGQLCSDGTLRLYALRVSAAEKLGLKIDRDQLTPVIQVVR